MSKDKKNTMDITNRILKQGLEDWKKFKFLQSDKLKEFPLKNRIKLKNSILQNNFVQSFKIWEHENVLYCLDGYHRILILKELEEEGKKIPKLLPVDYLQCSSKQEAAKLTLIYSSSYANITEPGLNQFLAEHDLLLDQLNETINLSLDLEDFNKKWLSDDLQITKENIKPFRRSHILISFPPEKLIEIQTLINEIGLIEGIEMEQGSN